MTDKIRLTRGQYYQLTEWLKSENEINNLSGKSDAEIAKGAAACLLFDVSPSHVGSIRRDADIPIDWEPYRAQGAKTIRLENIEARLSALENQFADCINIRKIS